jgi:N6-adenosine-specific RNA methylase IME4
MHCDLSWSDGGIRCGTTPLSSPLEFHPLADIFPLLEGYELAGLVDDIRAHGLHEPVVLYQGRVLDGRNRLRACEAAGVPCRFETYTGDDPISYVVSLNLRRRHLDESQRAMVAAKLATLKHGGDRSKSPIGDLPQAEAAELLNVGKRSVERAAEVRDHGAPELVSAVEHGAVSVSAAAVIAGQSIEEQRQILALVEPRLILKEAQKINATKAERRRAERITKIVEISNANSPLPQDRKYPIIYADPPWKFLLWNPDTADRSAEYHYPCMETTEICEINVPAAPDAVLFLWTTSPHLPEAFEVIEAWGFEYVTNIVWLKDKIGLGGWVRNQHELLLICRRGDMPTPLPANRPSSVIQAPRREHSRKPDAAYTLIEGMYPELPKIELFARNTRPGWDVWGNEVPQVAAE